MALEVLAGLIPPLIMGILLGGLYILIALGLSLVFGVMKLINVAHGDLVILGTYFGFFAMTGEILGHRLTIFGIDPILSLVIGIPLLFAIGFAIQKYLMSRAIQLSMEAPLIIAFGISLIIQNICQRLWTPYSRGLTTPYALKSFSVGVFHIPLVYLLDFIGAVIVMVILREFLRRTYLGKAIKGASQDRRAAQMMGINTDRVYAFAFAIAMATAAIAGVFLGLTFPFTPTSGVSFLIIAFGVIIIGGLGSMLGTFIGGMILGLAQTIGGYVLNEIGLTGAATGQYLFLYLIVLVVLAVRPQGIFGR
ncbi:MAG: branched-chain amino acid ABC transporter permease [Thermodesulfobacteriota bacterium]|jgi:branched-chain amino acid transport system permease protein